MIVEAVPWLEGLMTVEVAMVVEAANEVDEGVLLPSAKLRDGTRPADGPLRTPGTVVSKACPGHLVTEGLRAMR